MCSLIFCNFGLLRGSSWKNHGYVQSVVAILIILAACSCVSGESQGNSYDQYKTWQETQQNNTNPTQSTNYPSGRCSRFYVHSDILQYGCNWAAITELYHSVAAILKEVFFLHILECCWSLSLHSYLSNCIDLSSLSCDSVKTIYAFSV